MDLQGHGLTGPAPPERYLTDDYVRLLFALADSLKMTHFCVAGNSTGGGVCWKMALQRPDRVLGIILIDEVRAQRFPGGKKSSTFRLPEWPGTVKTLEQAQSALFFRMNLKQVFHDSGKITPEPSDRYYFLIRREGNREAGVKRLSQRGEDNGYRIGGISCPALVIWGREDAWIPVKTVEELHQKIRESELVISEGAGHVPLEEIPEPTVREALRFLKQTEALRAQDH